jgi:hypothetical protein
MMKLGDGFVTHEQAYLAEYVRLPCEIEGLRIGRLSHARVAKELFARSCDGEAEVGLWRRWYLSMGGVWRR